ncbi:MAG: sigma-70 family RNA polymerase sigma factor, partial [Acidobacteriota bacterium]
NLLISWGNGDEKARDQLINIVYDELHRMASNYLRREYSNHILQTTALVHEAYLRLIDVKSVQWQNRAHFFAIAAKLMRQILVHQARAANASKRGGQAMMITLDDLSELPGNNTLEIIALNDALSELDKLSPRQSQVVELRFFGGLTTEEIGEVLQVDPRTITRDWNVARAWLACQLQKQ